MYVKSQLAVCGPAPGFPWPSVRVFSPQEWRGEGLMMRGLLGDSLYAVGGSRCLFVSSNSLHFFFSLRISYVGLMVRVQFLSWVTCQPRSAVVMTLPRNETDFDFMHFIKEV